jgi:CBS domain-containing protein
LKNNTNIITATPDTPIDVIIQKMQINFVKHIVIESENKPVGIVTEQDISEFLGTDKAAKTTDEIPAKQVMKKNPVTITEGKTNFSLAAFHMDSLDVGSVIIVDSDKNLAGIITKTDITKAYGVVFGGKFKVKDCMSNKVFTCRESDSLGFALNMINQNDISRLIVTNNDGDPISVITTKTFLKHRTYAPQIQDINSENQLRTDSKKMCVGDLIKHEILYVNPEDDLSTAAQKMIKNYISGIPVVDNRSKLVGIVSNSDIVKAFVRVPLNDELSQKYAELY